MATLGFILAVLCAAGAGFIVGAALVLLWPLTLIAGILLLLAVHIAH